MRRGYSDKVIKELFALSGNRCAFPECTSKVIENSNKCSNRAIISEICHIHSISKGGPRYNPDIPKKDINSADNLILLCRNHHAIVDKQPETYTANALKRWKRVHEAKAEREKPSFSENIKPEEFLPPRFPTNLINQKIENKLSILRRSRFFMEFDATGFALGFAKELIEGELSLGTNIMRGRALAWCVRFLSATKYLEQAKEYLNFAKKLEPGPCPELDIATAFVFSREGDKQMALSTLVNIDLPLSKSAAFMIVVHHEGAEKAVSWLKTAGHNAKSLSSDGKFILLANLLELSYWDDARNVADTITDQDLSETPCLHHIKGIIYLLSAVPEERRSDIRDQDQVPFNAATFPLSSNELAIQSLEIAHFHFTKAMEIAQEFKCSYLSVIDDKYALWLELRNSKKSEEGRRKLEERLRESKSALPYVYLGFEFKVTLDLDTIEKEIEQQKALHGEITQDAALARFTLARIQKTPEGTVAYIEQHYQDLSKYIQEETIRALQAEVFCQAKDYEQAKKYLTLLQNMDLSESGKRYFRVIQSELKGTDIVDLYRSEFEKTGSLTDLELLIRQLEMEKKWNDLCIYTEILFEKNGIKRTAEKFAVALYNACRTERLIKFLETNTKYLKQSKDLQMLYSLSLYHEGFLTESHSELKNLSNNQDIKGYRTLLVSLKIALGDWNALPKYVENEYQQKENRDARELFEAAQLAFDIGSPRARDLVFAAADKGKNDAVVLTGTYFLALSADWNSDAKDGNKISQWLYRADELSSEDGPIQKLTLRDILNKKPEWDRRQSDMQKLLMHGDIPMFMAAAPVNKSLLDLMLFPALVNLSENDLTKKSVIPAYSGGHQSMQFDGRRIVGMEATTLLTLGLLNLLDKALDAFDVVYVPHSTLIWLFEEKKKVKFHQPRQIRDAHEIRTLLSTGNLEKVVTRAELDSNFIELSEQVGDELAMLIAQAKMNDHNDVQRLVIRPSPVYRLGSLMEKEAELTEHAAVMSSCLAVIDKLRERGQITIEEKRKAYAFLHLHEKPWPNQPKIADGATLYLDSLAVTYLLYLGVLGKLRAAGLRSIISPQKISEIDGLISYEDISSKADVIIETIRSTIASRIGSEKPGKIKVDKQHNIEGKLGQSKYIHPTFGAIGLAKICKAIISDDRYLNQHPHAEHDDFQTPIFSTIDLLDMLVSDKVITPVDRLEYKTKLRRAGYCFILVNDDELKTQLEASTVRDNHVHETTELKVIRENILHIRMSNLLQYPKDTPWLDETIKVFIQVLKSLWNTSADLSKVKVLSEWIVEQADIRGWVYIFENENDKNIFNAGWGSYILTLLIPPADISQDMRFKYLSWVEEKFLVVLKEQFPNLYTQLVEAQKGWISKMVNTKLYEGQRDKDHTRIRVQDLFMFMPMMICKTLLDDPEFREEYKIKEPDPDLTFTDFGVSILRSEFSNAIRNILSSSATVDITDTNKRKWQLNIESKEPLTLSMCHDKKRIPLYDYGVLSPDSITRLHTLDEVVSKWNLPAHVQSRWNDILLKRALKDSEVNDFRNEYCNTPVYMVQLILDEVKSGRCNVSSLIPCSKEYYARLVGTCDDSVSIGDYASKCAHKFFEQLAEWQPHIGFLFSLFLSSHSALTSEISTERLTKENLVDLYSFLEKYGDRISQLGAIEVGLRILSARSEIEPFLIRIIEQIRDDNPDDPTSKFQLLSMLFCFVDEELCRCRVLSEQPSFYRRLAAMSQAALVQSQLMSLGVDINLFPRGMKESVIRQYYLRSLVEMRLEPRWGLEYSDASQIQADFFGRIMSAAKDNEENINGSELYDLILGAGSESLFSRNKFLYSPLLGPLDGTGKNLSPAAARLQGHILRPLDGDKNNPNILPSALAKEIETKLSGREVSPSSFTNFVAYARLYDVDPAHVELAIKALKRCNHRFAKVENRLDFLKILIGLARVAAISRNHTFAEELRILIYKYCHAPQYALSLADAMTICIVAAASHSSLDGWCDFVGGSLAELASGELEDDNVIVLSSYLQDLCHIVPELWISCGKVDAVLKSKSYSLIGSTSVSKFPIHETHERDYLRFPASVDYTNEETSEYETETTLGHFTRPQAAELLQRIKKPREFIQVILGARQVGKTTLARQMAKCSEMNYHFASADEPIPGINEGWLESQWEEVRRKAAESREKGALLVLDEVHKVPRWSETVRMLWYEDTRRKIPVKVVLLGSAPLLVHRGLAESLTGRFEVLRLPHWSFLEMRQAFGWNLEQYFFYGAYPGAASLINEPIRWKNYILDSIVETTISHDVLSLSRVDKPALLRQLFELGCRYSSQILSYNKMTGHLEKAGNTTTLTHYLDLLTKAGMLIGLEKYSGSEITSRRSSPKLQVFNTALITARSSMIQQEALEDRSFWGRLTESAVGAHLANAAACRTIELLYWRKGNHEVDFVIRRGKKLRAIEVKSGRKVSSLSGLDAFSKKFSSAKILVVGTGGISLETFLSTPAEYWVQ